MPETLDHVAVQRYIASAGNDLCRIAHDKALWVSPDDEDACTALDKLTASVADRWNPDRPLSPFTVEVLTRFIQLCPTFDLIRTQHDTDQDEFHWAWVRLVFAAAGYEAHGPLASAACMLYPQCPLSVSESRDEWLSALDSAHRTCGWPVTVAFLPWKALVRALPYVERDEYIPSTFGRAIALLHALKHVRIDHGEDNPQFIVSFGGVSSFAATRNSAGILSEMRDTMSAITTMLGYYGSSTEKSQSPLRICWRSLANRLTAGSFLPRRPIAQLPGYVLAGPWSTVVPTTDTGRFAQTGLRLDGVWLAKDGRIAEYHGDDEDVVTYSWNIKNHTIFNTDRTRFVNGLPETYTVGEYPADLWANYFPNLDEAHFPSPLHKHAFRSLVDSIVVSSFLVDEFQQFTGEKPMLLCFPQSPEIESCTNQGKTTAALAITRAIVPGITQPVSLMTGASAPDQRSFAQQLLRYGTACIDEWFPTAKDGHVLSNRNLQAAMTGGRLTIGLAGENAPGVSLRYSLTASCKAGDFPPDLVNRVIPAFLGPLPETSRTGVSGDKLTSGQASLEIRLAALHYIDSTDLVEYLRSCAKPTNAWRYPWHLAVATHICATRTGLPISEVEHAVAEAVKLMAIRMLDHAKIAEESGLLTQLREGVHIELPIRAFFDNLTDVDLLQLVHLAEPHGSTIGGVRWLTASSLVRARKEAHGTNRAGVLLESITGLRAGITDRSLARTLLVDVRKTMKPDEAVPLPGTSYQLRRSSEAMEQQYDNKVWLRIEPRQPVKPTTL